MNSKMQDSTPPLRGGRVGLKSEKIKITGMACNHCVKAVEMELSKLKIKKYKVQLNSLDVEYNENKVTHEDIVKAIEEAGYEIEESVLKN